MTPIPTPFDIVEPPPLLWTPSLGVWIGCAALLLFLLLVIILRARPKARPPFHFTEALRRDVVDLPDTDTPSVLHHAVQLAQRALLLQKGLDVSAHSLGELQALVDNEQNPSEVCEVVRHLRAARQLLYQRSSLPHSIVECRAALRSATLALLEEDSAKENA